MTEPEQPPLDPEVREAAAAMEAMPLMTQIGDLLEWVGAGKPVTMNGGLRTADVPAAAALMGATVTLRAGGDGGEQPDLWGDVAPPSSAGSMWDAKPLAHAWVACQVGALLDVSAERATLTPIGAAWRDGSAQERFTAHAGAAVGWLSLLLAPSDDDLPIPPEVVEGRDVIAGDSREAGTRRTAVAELMLDSLADAPRSVPVPPPGASVAERRHREDVDRLVELGWFRLTGDDGTLVTIAPGLEPAIAGMLGALAERAEGVRADGSPRLPPVSTLAPNDAAFQLKVALVQVKPPVWRRVLVAADVDLGTLHRLVQDWFGWGDTHLHRFSAGDPYASTVVYESLEHQPSGTTPGPEVVDEATVQLRQLVAEPGQTLTYLYDFGDDWEHRLTVEAVVPLAQAGRTPQVLKESRGVPPGDDGENWT